MECQKVRKCSKNKRTGAYQRDKEANLKELTTAKAGTIGARKTNKTVLNGNSRYKINISKSILIEINEYLNIKNEEEINFSYKRIPNVLPPPGGEA